MKQGEPGSALRLGESRFGPFLRQGPGGSGLPTLRERLREEKARAEGGGRELPEEKARAAEGSGLPEEKIRAGGEGPKPEEGPKPLQAPSRTLLPFSLPCPALDGAVARRRRCSSSRISFPFRDTGAFPGAVAAVPGTESATGGSPGSPVRARVVSAPGGAPPSLGCRLPPPRHRAVRPPPGPRPPPSPPVPSDSSAGLRHRAGVLQPWRGAGQSYTTSGDVEENSGLASSSP